MRARVVLTLTILGLVMAVSAAPVSAGGGIIITKQAPLSVVAGETLIYTVTVTSFNPAPLSTVVTDFLPAALTPISASAAVGTVVITPLTVTWQLTLPANGSETLTITTLVDAATPEGTNIINTATLVAGALAASASVSTTVGPPSADLSITKTDSPDPVLAGGTMTYTIIIQNLGPSDAASVSWLDSAPTGISFTGVAHPGGSWNCLVVAATVGCSRIGAPLAISDGPQHFIVAASVDAGIPDPTIVTNTATVTSVTTADPNTANNTASAVTLVGTPTPPQSPSPAASLVDAATTPSPGSSLAALAFGALLLGTLGVLVVANARGVARRR